MIKIVEVQPIDGYRLEVCLSDGRRGIFDVSPYLERGIYQELKDPGYFAKVRLAFDGIAWPHEQDFSADTIDVEMEVMPVRSVAVANDRKASLTP